MKHFPVFPGFLTALALVTSVPLAEAQNDRTRLLEATQTVRLQSNLRAPAGPESAPESTTRPAPAYNSSSNRDYERREEEAALSRARVLKDAMRGAVSSLPSAERKSSAGSSTGITDGNWQADHLARIRAGYEGPRPPEPKGGMLARMGNALDSIAYDDDYVRRRRAGDTGNGFNPLDRLPKPGSREDGPGFLSRLPLPGGNGSDPSDASAPAPSAFTRSPDEPPVLRPLHAAPSPVGEEVSVAPAEPDAVPAYVSGQAARPAEPPDADPSAGPQASNKGFSMPWNRNKNSAPVADASAPVEADEPRPAPEEPRRMIPSIGRFRESSSPAPDEPLADASVRAVSSPGGTQFYPYESSSMAPKVLPEGALVQILKPGDEWSGVIIGDGTEGIIRTGTLRRAKASELPATRPAASASASRPSPSRAAAGYSAPQEVPLPEFPNPDATGIPLGHGLLPPLPPDN